jgi:quinol monooxygenase YgiN
MIGEQVKVAQVARMVAKPGKRQELVDALAPAFPKAEEEAGTELYIMMVNARTLTKVIQEAGTAEVVVTEHPDEVWFFELYEDDAAVKAHENGYALDRATHSIGTRLKELLAEPHTIVQANPVEAKGIVTTR